MTDLAAADPEVLWRPTADSIRDSRLGRFATWVADRRHVDFGDPVDYDALWRWSVDHPDRFWADLANFFDVFADVSDNDVLVDASMPGARWFPGQTLNYAELALRHEGIALVATSDDGDVTEISWDTLREQVGALGATLRGMGVGIGDRVVGYLPNIPETVVAFLATASIGAVWSACAPDFGAQAVLDRFAQIEPTVLIAVDGYRFRGGEHDRRDVVEQLRGSLPTLRATITVPHVRRGTAPDGAVTWVDAVADRRPPQFEAMPFDAPLWIVYSSGTTGLPKGIVHGHGGVTLEQFKHIGLHMDVGRGDRFFWYTSTAWMMWNVVASSLLTGATAVLYDGAPNYPELDAQFALAARTGITHLGTSAGYLIACEKAGLRPRDHHDLSRLRLIGSTGSPLPTTGFTWVYDAVSDDVLLASASGGTDVVTAFVGASPLLPVTAGELQRPMLAVATQSWNEDGEPVIDELGELVVTAPMPSMPLFLWNDPDGSRYRSTYFEPWPGVWRHGDWLEITSRGTCIITGRSDSTLNRGGVRMGTADIYAAVESHPAIADCVVLGIEQPDGGYWMPLFVQLADGYALTAALEDELRAAVREHASPRHVPDDVIAVPGIPHTRTGKRLEVPLKRVLQGVDPTRAVNRGAVDDADLIDFFVDMARRRR